MCFVKSLAYLMLAFQLLVANAASSKENEELRQFFKNNITPAFRVVHTPENTNKAIDQSNQSNQSNEGNSQLVTALLLRKQNIKSILKKKSIDINAPAIVDSCDLRLGWQTEEVYDSVCPHVSVNWLRALMELSLTPLQATCLTGDLEDMKLLIEDGASIDGGPKGLSPLISCLATKKSEQVDFLIDQGADVRLKNSPYSPLSVISMAYKNNSDQAEAERLAEKIIAKGADPHHLSPSRSGGISEFEVATRTGNLAMVEVLVKHGVDFNKKSSKGLTPLALAKKNNHVAIAKFLESRGAQE